jgi:hypothetical protein
MPTTFEYVKNKLVKIINDKIHNVIVLKGNGELENRIFGTRLRKKNLSATLNQFMCRYLAQNLSTNLNLKFYKALG